MWCVTCHQHPLHQALFLWHHHLQDLWLGSSHNSPGLTATTPPPPHPALPLPLPVAILGDKNRLGGGIKWQVYSKTSAQFFRQLWGRDHEASRRLCWEEQRARAPRPAYNLTPSRCNVRWILCTYITGMWSATKAGGFCIRGVASVHPVRLLGWLAAELCKVKHAVSLTRSTHSVISPHFSGGQEVRHKRLKGMNWRKKQDKKIKNKNPARWLDLFFCFDDVGMTSAN